MTNSKKVVTKMTKFVTKRKNYEETSITCYSYRFSWVFRGTTTDTKLQLRSGG